jgi:cell division septal protein FtsQ
MKYRVPRRPKIKIKSRYRPVVLRSNLRRERDYKIKNLFKLLFVLVLFAGIVFGAYKGAYHFVFDSGYFEIRNIEIKGLKNVTESEILALLPFRAGDNMCTFWSSIAENDVLNSKPELKDVCITRKWHRVSVEIAEREPLAYTVVNSVKLGVDNDNRPFALRGGWIKAVGQAALPEIVAANDADRKLVIDFIQLMKIQAGELLSGVSSIHVEPIDNLVLVMKDGKKIFWGEPAEKKLQPKMKMLNRIIEDSKKRFSGLEYINLYYFDDGRVLVKPVTGKVFLTPHFTSGPGQQEEETVPSQQNKPRWDGRRGGFRKEV